MGGVGNDPKLLTYQNRTTAVFSLATNFQWTNQKGESFS